MCVGGQLLVSNLRKSVSWTVSAVGSCLGKALAEHGIEKPTLTFPFCFLKSKMVPRVPSGETGGQRGGSSIWTS